MTSRITMCAIVTAGLLVYTHQEHCAPQQIEAADCFYFRVNPVQIFHIFIINSLLFGYHILMKFIRGKPDYSVYTFKSVIVAPFLEEILFRAAFYRVSGGQLPSYLMALIFSLSNPNGI